MERSKNLKEILAIDVKIRKLERDPDYRKIKETLKELERNRFGSPFISIPSPEDLEKVLRFRRSSAQLRETIELYRERRDDYRLRIHKLQIEKKRLRKTLFQ